MELMTTLLAALFFVHMQHGAAEQVLIKFTNSQTGVNTTIQCKDIFRHSLENGTSITFENIDTFTELCRCKITADDATFQTSKAPNNDVAENTEFASFIGYDNWMDSQAGERKFFRMKIHPNGTELSIETAAPDPYTLSLQDNRQLIYESGANANISCDLTYESESEVTTMYSVSAQQHDGEDESATMPPDTMDKETTTASTTTTTTSTTSSTTTTTMPAPSNEDTNNTAIIVEESESSFPLVGVIVIGIIVVLVVIAIIVAVVLLVLFCVCRKTHSFRPLKQQKPDAAAVATDKAEKGEPVIHGATPVTYQAPTNSAPAAPEQDSSAAPQASAPSGEEDGGQLLEAAQVEETEPLQPKQQTLQQIANDGELQSTKANEAAV